MKKSKSYFGNRFNTALRSIRSRKRTSQISVLPAPAAAVASEFEALESRILLSGITAGKVYKSVKFIDADGDQVTVSVSGKVAKGAGFTIDLLGGDTNNSDIENIKLVGLNNANAISVAVTPKVLFKGSSTIPSVYSGATTMVGSITTDNVTALRGINLSAAIVSNIDLGTTEIGSISLNTGRAQFIDRLNLVNNAGAFPYQPVTADIDLNDITAKSIGTLSIRGVQAAAPGINGGLTNNFDGQITVGGGTGTIGTILAPFSDINGGISAANIGRITALNVNTDLNLTGDLTIQFNNGFNGNIAVGGHINFALTKGNMTGTLTAGNGISGLGASTTDAIRLPGDFSGQLNTYNNPTGKNIGIADITVGGDFSGDISSSSSIGALSAQQFLAASSASATTNLTSITATGGGIAGDFNADQTIGNITARGTISANVTAGVGIGNITSTSFGADDAITGTFKALNGDLGNINATAVSGDAITSATFQAAGSIGTIKATVSNSGGGYGIYDSTFTADNNADNLGGIGNITVSSAAKDGIYGSAAAKTTFQGASIGDINVTMTNTAAGDAIGGAAAGSVTFQGQTNTETAPTSGKFNDLGTIGKVIITQTGTKGDGIENATFTAGRGGVGIGDITVTTVEGTGIKGSSFLANDGSGSGGDTLSTAAIGVIQVTSTKGAGLSGATPFTAVNGIGAITVISAKTGIDNGVSFKSDSNNDNLGGIGNIKVTITGPNADGIASADFTGASIASVQVNLNSLSGGGVGIDAGTFSGVTSEDFTDKDGKLLGKINKGFIGGVTVTNLSTNAAAHGLNGVTFNAGAAGTGIGAISVTTSGGDGINSTDFLANQGLKAFGASSGAIGTVTVNAAGAGISGGSDFTAAAGIGQVTVTAVTNGISGDSNFTANDQNGTTKTNTGKIDGISVTVTGKDAIGIGNQVDVNAAEIGNISVTVSAKDGGIGIDGANFTAVTATNTLDKDGKTTATNNNGKIGDIQVDSKSTTAAAISGADFDAGTNGSIGKITVTAVGDKAVAAVTGSNFRATNAGALAPSYASTIGNIDVTSTAGIGIDTSRFEAEAGIGTVKVTAATGGVIGSTFDAFFNVLAKSGGALTNVTVTVSGETGNGIDVSGGGYFYGSSIGDIKVNLTNAKSNGTGFLGTGAADVLTAAAGTIGTITIGTAGTGAAVNTVGFEADTSITGFNATGAVTNTSLNATGGASSIGPIDITGDAQIVVDAGASIGASKIGGVANLDYEVTGAKSSIGAIEGTGKGAHIVRLEGVPTTTLGNISFLTLANNDTVALTVVGAQSIGNISVAAPTGEGDLNLDASPLVTLGNISVDGDLNLLNNLKNAKTVGTVNAGVIVGGAQVGDKAIVGSSIGLITVNSGANLVTFEFAKMNNVVSPGSTVLAVDNLLLAANDITTAEAAGTVTKGGVTVTLV